MLRSLSPKKIVQRPCSKSFAAIFGVGMMVAFCAQAETSISETFEICATSGSQKSATGRLIEAGWNRLTKQDIENFKVWFSDGAAISLSGDLSKFSWSATRKEAKNLAETFLSKRLDFTSSLDLFVTNSAVVSVGPSRGNQYVNGMHCVFAGPLDEQFSRILDTIAKSDQAASIKQPIDDVQIASIKQRHSTRNPGDVVQIDARAARYLIPNHPYDDRVPTVESGFSLFTYTLK